MRTFRPADRHPLIMSLKAFHLLFITASTALALGCGVWGLRNYFSRRAAPRTSSSASARSPSAIGLVLYERYFLKKLKQVSYL